VSESCRILLSFTPPAASDFGMREHALRWLADPTRSRNAAGTDLSPRQKWLIVSAARKSLGALDNLG
jgi:hypothetical protein